MLAAVLFADVPVWWLLCRAIFFTIPIYHWVARALDGDWARGDIQVGPAPEAAKAQDVSAAVDTDVASSTAAEPSAKEGDE